ncbi:hypothetical protein KSS87_021343 [Heliosperma pusillum]|nr:hypothetical protein KSS87_013297 [Heliosperma pusillum]KAH9617298.1 hypothetical protein KSS87_021343 [Heliosperma pusillum]
MEQVKLFGVWGCPFSTRVEMALKLKGIEYDFVIEDMRNKSEELLKYNLITKKIPILGYRDIGATSSKALPMRGQGTEEADDELLTQLEILENEMKRNKLFKENRNKFLDIVGLYIIYWIPILQEAAGKDVFTRDKFPEIYNWADDILHCNIIKENLPNKEKMIALLRSLN